VGQGHVPVELWDQALLSCREFGRVSRAGVGAQDLWPALAPQVEHQMRKGVRFLTPLGRRANFPPKTNAANETLPQHQWNHRDYLFTFLRQPGLDATKWRAELAIRFGIILRNVWGGSRAWVGAPALSVPMSVWRTCAQQGRSALDFLSQLLRGSPVALALPP
jgi:hypothetical protein